MASSAQCQLIPFRAEGFEVARMQGKLEEELERMRNGYWLAHCLLKSRGQALDIATNPLERKRDRYGF